MIPALFKYRATVTTGETELTGEVEAWLSTSGVELTHKFIFLQMTTRLSRYSGSKSNWGLAGDISVRSTIHPRPLTTTGKYSLNWNCTWIILIMTHAGVLC